MLGKIEKTYISSIHDLIGVSFDTCLRSPFIKEFYAIATCFSYSLCLHSYAVQISLNATANLRFFINHLCCA